MHSRIGTCCSVMRNLFVWPRRALARVCWTGTDPGGDRQPRKQVCSRQIYVYKLPLERFDGARGATGQCRCSVVIAVGPERV